MLNNEFSRHVVFSAPPRLQEGRKRIGAQPNPETHTIAVAAIPHASAKMPLQSPLLAARSARQWRRQPATAWGRLRLFRGRERLVVGQVKEDSAGHGHVLAEQGKVVRESSDQAI